MLAKLDLIRRRALERLADAVLLDEPADQRALAAVDARLEPGIVPDRHEARLNRADRAAREFADEDVAVVDVHAHHRARRAHDALGDEVLHRADDLR